MVNEVAKSHSNKALEYCSVSFFFIDTQTPNS